MSVLGKLRDRKNSRAKGMSSKANHAGKPERRVTNKKVITNQKIVDLRESLETK